MPLTGFHLHVARIVGAAVNQLGFALGGGYALQVHGISDRPSEDIDTYVNSMNVELFERAERGVCDQLRNEGLDAEVVRSDSWFRGISVHNKAQGTDVVVDLGYDYRSGAPIQVAGVGAVLAVDDVVTSKVRAFVERGAARDYSDIDNILAVGGWTVDDLADRATNLFPHLPDDVFMQRLRGASEKKSIEFAVLGVDAHDLAALDRRLTAAASRIDTGGRSESADPATRTEHATCAVCGRPLTSAQSIVRGTGPTCAKK